MVGVTRSEPPSPSGGWGGAALISVTWLHGSAIGRGGRNQRSRAERRDPRPRPARRPFRHGASGRPCRCGPIRPADCARPKATCAAPAICASAHWSRQSATASAPSISSRSTASCSSPTGASTRPRRLSRACQREHAPARRALVVDDDAQEPPPQPVTTGPAAHPAARSTARTVVSLPPQRGHAPGACPRRRRQPGPAAYDINSAAPGLRPPRATFRTSARPRPPLPTTSIRPPRAMSIRPLTTTAPTTLRSISSSG